ncbi:hypothetical protein H4R20_002883 [Coemansia guatemalensis]|uniref:FHF complex subunit HOOK-interacting protein C-terminal domain-containing protein n=1 Tax=Coemansia guatemalensis TaxID=2761395 RepID=A0A9W8LUL1_9FUNG|nr:hypothetical protein H4R20_002883 [Coemansia guatemalensis]
MSFFGASGEQRQGTGMMGRVRTLVDNVAEAFESGSNRTRRDSLLWHWERIHEHYSGQRQDDLRRQQLGDTAIPQHLDGMMRALASEILEAGASDQAEQPLEFGACMEYLLQYHVLGDLVDFADIDLPRGMRAQVVRFFDDFVASIPLGLLPESAIRLPLVAVMRQSLRVVQACPADALTREVPNARLGLGYGRVHRDPTATVLCYALLRLIATLLARLREHAIMACLFFDSGAGDWPRGGDLAVVALRATSAAAAAQPARGHELFIVHVIVEYLLAPGEIGAVAREALVEVVRVLVAPDDRARYVRFVVEQARIPALLVEHMAYLHAQLPVSRPVPRADVSLFGLRYAGARKRPPLERRMYGTQADFRPEALEVRLRKLLARPLWSPQGERAREEARVAAAARQTLEHVDAFFLCWELLDEVTVAAQTESRVVAAVQSQLTNGFLRSHIEPALLSARDGSCSHAITTVSYLADLVATTHSDSVLDALFAVLLGPGLGPERLPESHVPNQGSPTAEPPQDPQSLLSQEDQKLIDAIEDDELRAEAIALLLPADSAAVSTHKTGNVGATTTDTPLRTALITWMTTEDGTHLSLNTLRLFDAILGSMNQFAYNSLVLRNFGESVAGQPALGRGQSAAADQELVRAVVERFLDAAPSTIAAALPETVVSAAIHIDNGTVASPTEAPLPTPPQQQSQTQNGMLREMQLREAPGCDEYAADCMRRLRVARQYISCCWKRSLPTDTEDDDADKALASFYPGAFLASLIRQLTMVVRRHMAYNLLLTSMLNRLVCVADPALCAYLFLASSAVLPPAMGTRQLPLYDALVQASADAYVKSERVPRFAARLTRQHREGVETAVRVGAVKAASAYYQQQQQQQQQQSPISAHSRQLQQDSPPPPPAVDEQASTPRNRGEVAAAAAFLGTPIKRFVHGYIVLDEFAKEMAAAAMALHSLELDRQLDRAPLKEPAAVDDGLDELLDYYDPEEPAYRQASIVCESLRASRNSVIDLSDKLESSLSVLSENKQNAPVNNHDSHSTSSPTRQNSTFSSS